MKKITKIRQHFQNKITIWDRYLFVFFTRERVFYLEYTWQDECPTLEIFPISTNKWQSVALKCLLHTPSLKRNTPWIPQCFSFETGYTHYYQCADPSIIVRLHDQGASTICKKKGSVHCSTEGNWCCVHRWGQFFFLPCDGSDLSELHSVVKFKVFYSAVEQKPPLWALSRLLPL